MKPTRKLNAFEQKAWDRLIMSWPSDHWVEADSDLMTGYVACIEMFEKAIADRDANVADRMGKLMLLYATKLRITPHSRYDPKTAYRAAERGRINVIDDPLLAEKAWQ
jgi:hypothetical protein